MAVERVSPALLQPLKEALTHVYWFKRDLRPFLTITLQDRALVGGLDWEDYKRNIVGQLVDHMATNQRQYSAQLVDLILATAEITDPAWLRQVEDGDRKYEAALVALEILRNASESLSRQTAESSASVRRRQQDSKRAAARQALDGEIGELRDLLITVTAEAPHRRGYSLETLLNRLFATFDLDAKGPFRVVGEQIDGAFSFEGTDYLLEAKWTDPLTPASDLDVFAAKVGRRLDNTLGLFVSVNGFQSNAISLLSGTRPRIILMDGGDLSAVLDSRIDLLDLLRRKRQHASRTGQIMLSATDIL